MFLGNLKTFYVGGGGFGRRGLVYRVCYGVDFFKRKVVNIKYFTP
jgi:hypothetical protein